MVNWRTYTIQNIKTSTSWVEFTLDGYVTFSNGVSKDFIYCEKRSPFSNWEVGYHIDIDLDRTKHRESVKDIDSTTIVRLSSSSVLLLRDNNLLSEMRRTVERDRNISLEFMQEEGVKPDGTVYRMQGWRYGRR